MQEDEQEKTMMHPTSINLEKKTVSFFVKLIGVFKLIRVFDTTTASLAVFVSLYIASNSHLEIDRIIIVYAMLSTFMAATVGMVANDIVDYPIDLKKGALKKPLVAQEVTLKEAKIILITAFILGFIPALLIDLNSNVQMKISVVFYLVNVFFLFMYNLSLKNKGLPGNVIIGYLTLAIFIYGDLLVNHKLSIPIVLLGLIAFFIFFTREIIKSIGSMNGDDLESSASIAIKYGKKTASIISTVLLIIVILLASSLIYFANLGPMGRLGLWLVQLALAYTAIEILIKPVKQTANSIKTRLIILSNFVLLFFILDIIL